MSVSDLSRSTQDYLKVIWGLSEWSTDPVTPTLIARKTGLRLSSVSDAVRRLTEQGFLTHDPYGAVELTDCGRTHALEMVRRHRLIETFLVEVLDCTWDQVHNEAENLEHAVSDFLVDKIDRYLGSPTRDPHGDPIPDTRGTVEIPRAARLTGATPGETLTVERISDEDPSLLQFLAEKGITVGTVLHVGDTAPFSDTVKVQVDDLPGTVSLGGQATDRIYVSHADS